MAQCRRCKLISREFDMTVRTNPDESWTRLITSKQERVASGLSLHVSGNECVSKDQSFFFQFRRYYRSSDLLVPVRAADRGLSRNKATSLIQLTSMACDFNSLPYSVYFPSSSQKGIVSDSLITRPKPCFLTVCGPRVRFCEACARLVVGLSLW